jgi:predicted nucleic acid-binding protein
VNRSVVLDTNVVVSAALHLDGPPGLLVQAVLRRELACFTCPGIADEYWDVLTRAKFVRLGFPPPWFEPFLEECRHLEPAPPRDPDDLIFLSLAHRAGAVLVSGNLADFPAEIRRKVRVLEPRDYLESLV